MWHKIRITFSGLKRPKVISNLAKKQKKTILIKLNILFKKGVQHNNKELSEVLGLEIDTVSKFVVFHYRAGYAEEFWDTLRYENNKLIFVKGLYQERWDDTLGNSWTKRTYKRAINDRLTVRIDSFMVK